MTVITNDEYVNDEGQLVTVVRNVDGDIIGWNITTLQTNIDDA